MGGGCPNKKKTAFPERGSPRTKAHTHNERTRAGSLRLFCLDCEGAGGVGKKKKPGVVPGQQKKTSVSPLYHNYIRRFFLKPPESPAPPDPGRPPHKKKIIFILNAIL